MMKGYIKILNVLVFFLALLLVFAIGFRAGQKYDIAIDENDDYVAISYSVNEQKIRRLMSLIDNYYVDTIDTDSIVDNTIEYVLSNLDPHSVYLDQKNSEMVSNQMKGYYIGIGIQYVLHRDTLLITQVNPDSPNAKKLKLGDQIIAVNHQNIIGKDNDIIESLIKGKVNSKVDLAVLRNQKIKNITASRSIISNGSVSAAYMIDDKIGYVKLKRFGDDSVEKFKKGIRQLKKEGLQTLVLDLRGNGGGLMSAAEKIADEFLTENQLIVFTKDAKDKKVFFYATQKGDLDGKHLYVLIDEQSASASEIVAGAIQDNDAGIIVGRRSFGKGLVQREISLGDGTKLRLTTARYYTPSGKSIQKPYHAGSQEYNQDLSNRYLRGEMYSADSIEVADSLQYKTIGGRTVYGGGGIIPDVFVPIDSVKYSVWFYNYNQRDVFDEKLVDFIIKNKKQLNKIREDDYIKFYQPNQLTKELLDNLQGKKYNFTQEEKDYFKTFVKASLAAYVYGDKTSDKIWSLEDKMIQKVLELEKDRQ